MSEILNALNPKEELDYLRAKVLEAEKRNEGIAETGGRESLIRSSIEGFKKDSSASLDENRRAEIVKDAESVVNRGGEVKLEEMVGLAEKKGIIHTLSVVEKMKGWHFEDDFHKHLVNLVEKGLPVKGAKKGPIYKALHMTLFEIVLPKNRGETEKGLPELVKGMEQLYAGLLSLSRNKKNKEDYLAFEIANPDGEENTRMFVSVPTVHIDLFSKQLLSIFPRAQLMERENDYNIFNESGITFGATAELVSSPAYPLKTIENFGEDPLNVIINGFSKISAQGGAALQIIFRPVGDLYVEKYKYVLKQIEKGKKPKEALRDDGLVVGLFKTFGEIFLKSEKKKEGEVPTIDQEAFKIISSKIESPIVETNIRLAVSSATETEADRLMHNFESAFNQFENPGKQSFKWRIAKSNAFQAKENAFYRSFIFRLFDKKDVVPLNLKELSNILHFHTEGLAEGIRLNRLTSKGAAPALSMPESGTLLGINRFQGQEKKIFISEDDRLRHFYTIGQTGTGKSTLLKNMAIDDIKRGEGICYIDPHGSDILDVLAAVPAERINDVIYFDPADVERPMGLNMLEYDQRFPEQKTFVVNELFSIFQKLYGKVPESMGPMFEQYFRNAAMLVIEDPATGSTLLDVSRVLSNKEYRELKLSHCQNPIIIQFWKEVAEKAGGEAALANIVPYITSKFDVFLVNDIMRPIMASEHTAFNLRQVMDEKKILLINLSKGRLGDINANLIGLIVVGKILLAALSRVNLQGSNFPPFYLYIDEFQNVTTNSISTILSEARKYKLSLTVAHQFIAQLEEDIKNAVFGNIGTICAFRVGVDDAKYLESHFAPTFTADDLMNIDNRKAYIRMLVNGRPVDPFDIEIPAPAVVDRKVAEKIAAISRERFGRPRFEAEREIQAKYSR